MKGTLRVNLIQDKNIKQFCTHLYVIVEVQTLTGMLRTFKPWSYKIGLAGLCVGIIVTSFCKAFILLPKGI